MRAVAVTSCPIPGTHAKPQLVGPVTRTDIVRYAGASGAFHPLHYDQEFAEQAGYPTVFSIGMYQAGLLATFATDWLGAERIRRFAVRFAALVWPGDELTCTGIVSDSHETAAGTRAIVDLVARRQTDEVAVTGVAEFLFSR